LQLTPNNGVGYGLLRYGSDNPEIRRKLGSAPAAEISFNYLGQFQLAQPENTLLTPIEGAIGPAQAIQGKRTHLLELNSIVVGGRLHLQWTYSDQIFHTSAIQALSDRFRQCLQFYIESVSDTQAALDARPADFTLVNLTESSLRKIAAHIDSMHSQSYSNQNS
jgi:non-ribosomal peptide synthase protein (TIGR01720 family)